MNKKLILALAAGVFSATSHAEGINLNPVVVSATRSETNTFDAPAAIDVVDKSAIQDGQWGMVLSESLKRVPGVSALSRNQYAQDPVISSRGFGARSTFGVSGIRLYVDKIPFTMPDGIGQPGNIDFGMVESIEVLKGPFSSMYGNGAGGVVSMKTIAPPKDAEIAGSFMVGSYGTTKESAKLAGTLNGIGYVFNESIFNTAGYRDNSAAHKKQSTALITFDLQNDAHVTILADYMKMRAQDPLGLAGTGSNLVAFNASKSTGYTGNIYSSNSVLYTQPATAFQSAHGTIFSSYVNNIPNVLVDPKAVPVAAIAANTRVYRENTQVGINLDYDLNTNNSLNLVIYGGHRSNNQFLATGTAPYFNGEGTASPRPRGCNTALSATVGEYCGKDSTVSRDFVGIDFNWANSGSLLDHQYKVVSGISYAYMSDARKDVGTGNGVIRVDTASPKDGSVTDMNLNRLETDNSFNLDEYVQGQLALNSQLDLHAGVRNVHSMMIFNPTLQYQGTTSFPKAQSISYASMQFNNTTPSIGAVWKVMDSTNIYADYGKGFQTPNSIQMAYSNGTTGLGPNTALSGSTSDSFELGIKSFINPTTRINAAIFKIVTANEIEIASGGAYTVYRNITSDTKRNGFEASISTQLPNNLDLYGAYTYLDAKFDGNLAATDSSLNSIATISKGNKIPGIARNQFYGEASWTYPAWGFRTAVETIVNSRIYANDTNNAYANGYALANLRATLEQKLGHWRLSEFARVENIFDRNYIGAVRINDSNGQYYEAGAGRNYMAGVSATYQF